MAQVLFATDTTCANADLDANFTELYNKSAYSSTGIGYATGAGGSVTQLTSKSTGVTLNKMCGKIVMHNASLAASTTVVFVLTNSMLAATDVLSVSISGAIGNMATYNLWAYVGSAGSAQIALRNISGGALGEVVEINFAVIKVVTS